MSKIIVFDENCIDSILATFLYVKIGFRVYSKFNFLLSEIGTIDELVIIGFLPDRELFKRNTDFKIIVFFNYENVENFNDNLKIVKSSDSLINNIKSYLNICSSPCKESPIFNYVNDVILGRHRFDFSREIIESLKLEGFFKNISKILIESGTSTDVSLYFDTEFHISRGKQLMIMNEFENNNMSSKAFTCLLNSPIGSVLSWICFSNESNDYLAEYLHKIAPSNTLRHFCSMVVSYDFCDKCWIFNCYGNYPMLSIISEVKGYRFKFKVPFLQLSDFVVYFGTRFPKTSFDFQRIYDNSELIKTETNKKFLALKLSGFNFENCKIIHSSNSETITNMIGSLNFATGDIIIKSLGFSYNLETNKILLISDDSETIKFEKLEPEAFYNRFLCRLLLP